MSVASLDADTVVSLPAAPHLPPTVGTLTSSVTVSPPAPPVAAALRFSTASPVLPGRGGDGFDLGRGGLGTFSIDPCGEKTKKGVIMTLEQC